MIADVIQLPKPVKVLCYFKAWSRYSNVSMIFFDSIMIRVTRSEDIERTFNAEMQRRIYNRFSVGPTPTMFKLISFMPENGRADFNIYQDRCMIVKTEENQNVIEIG